MYADKHGSLRVLAFAAVVAALGFALRGVFDDPTLFSHQVGGFLDAWLGGKLYDTTGDYEAMWVAAIVLGLIATVLHLPIREKPGALAKAEAS